MITKDDLLAAMLRECDIAVHLYHKLPEGSLDYSPTEGQRSTLELLRYLSFCAIGGTLAMLENGWDGYKVWAEKAQDLPAEEFPAAMERQKQALVETFAGISDDDFQNRTAKTPISEEMKLAVALLQVPHDWLVGYRMQLFLYAKAAGNDQIWTANCWAGVDMPHP